MNCEQVQSLTDAYRDGELQGPEAQALEQHLADCTACEHHWRRESAWMAVLAEKTPIVGGPSTDEFTARVVRRWNRQNQPNVLARIGRLSAAAAVIALMLSLAAVFVLQGPGSPSDKGTTVAVSTDPQASPISVLMADAWRGARAPRAAIHQTTAYLDFASFTRMFAEDEPQPNGQD